MTLRRETAGEISFAAEGMAGTAGSAALRRVRSLADMAPTGRLFGAIATLSEMSRAAERHLATGASAMSTGDDAAAVAALNQSLAAMNSLAVAAAPASAASLPAYLNKKAAR